MRAVGRLLLVLAALSLPDLAAARRGSHVRGYTRKDGTYVRPHYRSGSPSLSSFSSSSYRSTYRAEAPVEPAPIPPEAARVAASEPPPIDLPAAASMPESPPQAPSAGLSEVTPISPGSSAPVSAVAEAAPVAQQVSAEPQKSETPASKKKSAGRSSPRAAAKAAPVAPTPKVDSAKTPAAPANSPEKQSRTGALVMGVVLAGGVLIGALSFFRSRAERRQAEKDAAERQAQAEERARLAAERARQLDEYKKLLAALPARFTDDALAAVRAAREASAFTFESVWKESFDAVGGIASAMLREGTSASQLIERLEPAARAVGMPALTFDQLKAQTLRAIIWSYLEDKLLTEHEDDFVASLRETLSVPGESLRQELQALDQYRRLREITPWSLPAETVDFKLRAGETCHHKTSGSLKEKRVARSYVRDGTRIKEEELVSVRDGDVYFTSERILIVGDGTTQIPNDKILAVETDWNAGIIEVTKDGRKAPFYIAVADPIFCGNLISIIRQAA